MSKYIQKPVEVDARQFTEDPENGPELATWVKEANSDTTAAYWAPKAQLGLELKATITIFYEGSDTQDTMFPGDWLVQMDDEFHVYSDGAFQKRFDKVEEK
jgi:hypothetical protein